LAQNGRKAARVGVFRVPSLAPKQVLRFSSITQQSPANADESAVSGASSFWLFAAQSRFFYWLSVTWLAQGLSQVATFIKRGASWTVRVRKAGVNRSATFRTKAEATYWASQLENEITLGKLGKEPDRPFSDLIERYIKEVTPTKRGARAEEFRLNRMIGLGDDKDGQPRKRDELANVRLPDLSTEHIAAWRDRRLKQVSVASVLREWATLAHACAVAVAEWKWLTVNPCVGVKKPEPPKARTRSIPDDEIERILLAAGYQREIRPETQTARVGAAFLYAIETAMRAGEICNQRWEHVDLLRRVVHLPKTKNGHARDVPLSKEAVRLLGQMEGNAGVFDLKAASLDALFRKIKARAVIEDLHFHDSRAEALTRMAAKVDVMTLAKISGHRDLRILLNTYYRKDMADVAGLLD
jgi:integrase